MKEGDLTQEYVKEGVDPAKIITPVLTIGQPLRGYLVFYIGLRQS